MSDNDATDHMQAPKNDRSAPRKPSLWRTVKSVAAAFLGVQSTKNWHEDIETSSSPLRFVLVGLAMGFVFFGLLFLITWIIASLII